MNQPIRVLHVVTYMGRGGLETMIMNYYRHIDRSKVQFDFLVHRDFRADYDDEIEALGGQIFRIPRLIPWSKTYLTALERFFRAHPEYKIVHVHQDCLSSVILKAANKCGVPVRIAHSHNSSQDKNIKYLIKLFYKKQIPTYATQLFACSRAAGQWMFGTDNFQVMNNAIDTQKYAFDPGVRESVRNELAIPAETPVLGHVGRFMPAKNHAFLIELFSKLPPNAYLLLVGDGELREKIEYQARELGVRERIIFTGVRTDVARMLQAMDIFLFPSLYEGLGIAAIEAQTAGLPCLISDGVPMECQKTTGLVYQLPLSAGADRWALKAQELLSIQRKSTAHQVKNSGFDIVKNAQWLQAFYLEQ